MFEECKSGVAMSRILKLVATVGTVILFGGFFTAPTVNGVQASESKKETFSFLLKFADYSYGSSSSNIKLAKDMCRDFKKAKTKKAKRKTAKTYGRAMKFGSRWPDAKIIEFTSIASTVYCPAQSFRLMNGVVAGI